METLEIGLTCSPAKHVSNKVIKAYEILVSWGGGIGGANKTYYATKIKILSNYTIITLLTGEEIELNRNFIVHTKNVTIVISVIDITEHINYSEYKYRKAIQTNYVLLNFNENYVITNKYESYTKRIVHTNLDKE